MGSKNEVNEKIRYMFAQLLNNQLPNLEQWLIEGAKRDPLKTADLLLRISERFTPSLSRTEITGVDGQPFSAITINLPTINVPTPILGEGASVIPIQSHVAGALESGEGSLAESQGKVTGEGASVGHLEHSDSVVSGGSEHYEHLDSAVSSPDQPVREASQDRPEDEESLKFSPIFAPNFNAPLKKEDEFDPVQVQKLYEDMKSKRPNP